MSTATDYVPRVRPKFNQGDYLMNIDDDNKCTTTTADWPLEDLTNWACIPHGDGHVDLNFFYQEDGEFNPTDKIVLIVYQASDDGSQTNCNDPTTWRAFDLVERPKEI
jgi:hypothetical protein|tara:strand:+ start:180 stop:503 length:324 start_codon:yes stop_codon:yes gene_type:complete